MNKVGQLNKDKQDSVCDWFDAEKLIIGLELILNIFLYIWFHAKARRF